MNNQTERKTDLISDKVAFGMIPVYGMVLECMFHWEIYRSFDVYMLYAVLFSLPFYFFASLGSATTNDKWNVGVRCVATLLITIYYTIQIIYHQVFGNFLSVKSIFNGADQAMDFGFTIWEAFLEHVASILFVWILWIAYLVLQRRISESVLPVSLKRIAGWLVVIVVVPVLGTIYLMSRGTGFGTTYDVKMSFHRTEQSMYRLGLLQTLKKDLIENICDKAGVTQKQINAPYLWIEEAFFAKDVDKLAETSDGKNKADTIIGEKNEINATASSDDVTDADNISDVLQYHTWDINFDSLIASADNEDEKDAHTYFSKLIPTKENAYTGLFEGYNLIYITAESFSDVVIDKKRTPTLYRMQQEGFQFNNFYTPSWYLSTIDGEYVNLLSQIPVEGDWSLQHSAKNQLPIALGNQLESLGYVCHAYHNHDSYYYDRTITHPNLGYTFKAVGAGLTFESMYPESDLELMEITADAYINQDKPFHTYYMTMSGHLPYTYDYNSMAVKNREVIAEEEWSENAACYLAANTELEYAVSYLVEKLEAKGKLDNTLFVIVADHYPYGLKKGAYDELQGKEVENDVFEIYRNTCLIWSASMKDLADVDFPVRVDKYCSNLDVLPTISNLMGLSYDSRLLAGRDMLSDEEGLVLLKDYSFITDKVRYNATTDEAIWAAGVKEDAVYLAGCKQVVADRFFYAGKILELDYYNLIK